MCYHYSIAKTAEEISRTYKIGFKHSGIDPEPLFYHANGFDHPHLPVVYQDDISHDLKLEFMQWGLVPGWVKGEEQALKMRSAMLNARSETVDLKPGFRAAFRYRPCLVPASGYFEWMHYQGKKYPFHIFLTDRDIFSFAGIWEEWVNHGTGEILRSFSLITCPANELTARIHNTKKRMPVILEPECEPRWLDTDRAKQDRKKLLEPLTAGKMDACSIGRLITSRDKESNVPEVIGRHDYPELN